MIRPNNNFAVRLVGDVHHPDFRDAIERIRADARLCVAEQFSPELIVVAQSRPDTICSDQLSVLHRDAPLSGIVALLGSWCEGEMRTGRPWPGAQRLYWYEFPAWWQRQLLLRAVGRCPDWARPTNVLTRLGEPDCPGPRSGLVVLQTARRDNADALGDGLQHAGYSTIWQPPGRPRPLIRGAVAGIWDGAQLNESEEADLAAFCTQMAHDGAAVLALLDFPRRDRVDQALQIGAGAVLGKPWLNSDLVATLKAITASSQRFRAA